MKHLVFTFCFCIFTLTTGQIFAAKKCNTVMGPEYKDAIPGNVVSFESKTYPGLVYDNYKPNPGAVYIRPKGNREENLAKAKTYIILIAGVGADFSNPNSMLHQYGNYTGIPTQTMGKTDASGYGKRQILDHIYFQEGIYVEIIPLPGSTFGGKTTEQMGKGIDAVLNQAKEHILDAKAYLPADAQTIIHGRSYGATVGASLAHKFPGLVDKLILVGLATPRKDLIEKSQNVIKEVEEKGRQGLGEPYEINWPWTNWFNGILSQSKWYDINKNKLLFGGAETLIVIGEKDWQVVDDEKIIYADMDLKSPNVHFRLIPSAEHDATKTKYNSNKLTRMGVYGNMIAFKFIFDQ